MKRTLKIIASALGGLILIVSFQNCTNEKMTFQDSVYNDNLKYFNYKYQSASPYYHDIRVLKGSQEGNQETFQVIGSISRSNPDDSTPIKWRVRLLNNEVNSEADCGALNCSASINGESAIDGTLVYRDELAAPIGNNYNRLWIEIEYGSQIREYEVNLNL